MVATAATSLSPRYRTPAAEGYDGVVRVSFDGFYATGSLLYDGRAILTAAHLFSGHSGTARITLETSQGRQVYTSSEFIQHPDYDSQGNNDLALVWLNAPAPATADRYALYRDNDEIGQAFTLVGYGRTGAGSKGAFGNEAAQPARLKAENRFDADAGDLKAALGSIMAWTPLADTQLIADFDDGRAEHDALGRLLGQPNLGRGLDEGLIAPGDSGGPALLGGKLAGVASYTTSLAKGAIQPDIDSTTNSSFGEIAAWQRVSYYQQWIDQSLRAHYPDAPSRPEDVQKEIPEAQSGSHYAYFLLQFTGVRSDPQQILSVDFATRDGTAQAGSDYLPMKGTLKLYPDENQAVIPVEIRGDTQPEPDEYFFLDVTNPVGGSFGAGIVMLTAMRTILDDDGWLG